MRRVRRFAIVLLALGVVTAAIYATGAFTNLTAQRDADVAVTGDASAYLSLKPSSGPNGAYASYENGQLQVVVGDSATGSGVNRDAVTTITDVFTITNQGAQSVGLWLADGSDAVTFTVDGQSIEGKGQAITIPPGTTKSVGLVIDTRQVSNGQDLLESVTFHSSAAVAGSSVPAQSRTGSEPAPPDSSKPPATDPPTETQTSPSTPEPEPTPKPKDGGGMTLTDNPITNTITNTVEGAANMLMGVARDQLKKVVVGIAGEEGWNTLVGYLTAAKEAGIQLGLSTIKTLAELLNNPLESAWKAAVGAVFAGIGMPGGPEGFTAKEVHSPFYTIGWIGATMVPIVDIVTGIRDLVYSAAKLDAIGFGVELVGLIPAVGKASDAAQSISIVEKWLDIAKQSQVGELLGLLRNGIISSLPTKYKKKMLDLFPGSSKKVTKKKVSDSQLNIYRKTDDLPSYTRENIDDLTKRGDFTADDIRTFANEGVNLERVKVLRNKQIPAEDIRYYIKNDMDLNKVADLRNQQLSSDRIRMFMKKDVDKRDVIDLKRDGFTNDQIAKYVKKGEDLKQVKKLKHQGLTPDQITYYVKKFNRKRHLFGNLEQISHLKSQGFSHEQMRFLVDNGISLKGVSWLEKNVPARYGGVPRNIITYLKTRELVGYYNYCRVIRTWRSEHLKKDDKIPQLPKKCTATFP
jgi:DNA-binding transcriptional MerR regulator